MLSKEERKEVMISSVVCVSGPFQCSQGGSGSSWGRWYIMSEDSRCGIF
jgi:hypothetical protein